MKFNSKHLSILLILLIGLSNISSTSLSIKRNKHKNHLKTKLTSKEAATAILAKLKTSVTDPQSIAFFAMGVLSVWFDGFEKLYTKIKTKIYFFRPCYKFIKQTWDMINGTPSAETNPAEKAAIDAAQAETQQEIGVGENRIANLEVREEQASDKDKKKLCTKTKEKVHEVYKTMLKYFLGTGNEYASYERGSSSLTPVEYCEYVSKSANRDPNKTLKLLKKDIESEDDFLAICLSVRQTADCDQYQPDNKGALYFIKQTVKYALFMKNGISCIFNLVKGGGEDTTVTPPVPKDLEVASIAATATGTWALTKQIFTELGAFILHLVTFGIFGALRAAWNIMKLTLAIYLMVADLINDIPFKLGKLVGLALKALKNMVAGRRRRR